MRVGASRGGAEARLHTPQVEYALTELGREFLTPVRGLAEWVVANSGRMDEARANYAERRAA